MNIIIMRLLNRILDRNLTYPESNGYYDRVPIRIKSYTLVENTKDYVIYQTTDEQICDGKTELKIRIYRTDEGNWGINAVQGGVSHSIIGTGELTDEKLSRRRAFWHAGQYMKGESFTHQERYTLIHQVYSGDTNMFKDDKFFKNGDSITTDPFGEFLK